MSKITSKLKAILASLRRVWINLVQRVTYAVNPFYRGLYSLYDLQQEYYSHLENILQRENSDDFYYSSSRFKYDEKYRDKLFFAIEKLKDKVREIKKEGY